MGKKVRSARGELIDFDLMKIKEQIASNPPSIDVQQRQNFIDKRLRRRLKKAKQGIDKVPVDVDAKVADGPASIEEPVIEQVDQKPTVSPRKKKQKARKKKPQ